MRGPHSAFRAGGLFFPALLLVLLSGCALFTPERRDPVPEGFPSGYTLYSEEGREDGGRWWEAFGNPELNRMVAEALGGNFSLREAWARVDQARAVALKAGAAQMPSGTADSGLSRSDGKTTGSVDTLSLGMAAAYEVDLWGRLGALTRSADLLHSSAQADLESAAMTVAAGVAEGWVDLIAARQQLRLLESQVTTNETLLKLQELRFEKSMGSALDVLQQLDVLERSRALIPPVAAFERQTAHGLAFLMGKAPGADLGVDDTAFPELSELPVAGLPADLLAMRPDVRAAGLRLRATDWEVAAARADRLPALNLTGSFGYSGSGTGILFDQWVSALSGSLAGPLFDGGRRKAEVERTRAVARQRLAVYEKTVFTAVREVEDSLVAEQRQWEHLAALEKAQAAARSAYEEAGTRYVRGLETFLPMLIELRSVQELEREVVRQRAVLVKFRIGLHRALGGSWAQEMAPSGLSDAARIPTRERGNE